ncbi:MAG: FtsX-like permease family protein [Sediminibacterium sp.]|nr:FtsX-like permease family protein [Sediminibacterium sp.]
MLKNYFKIAIAVLKRRKFFTFISLFGISFTLTILIVLTAFIDHLVNAGYPEGKRDRSLYINTVRLEHSEKHYINSGSPSYYFLDKYAKPLKTPAKIAIASLFTATNAYVNNKKLVINLKYTDDAYWEVTDYVFLEGKPFTKQQIDNADKVAVITEGTRKQYFGDVTNVVGKYIETDNVQYRVQGVVKNVPMTMLFAYADMYLPYTVSKADYRSKVYTGGYFAILLARSKSDIPKIQAEFAGIISKVPTNSKEFDLLFCHADTYTGSIIRQIFGDGNNSGKNILLLVVSIFLLLFMLLPTLNLVNINISRIMERSSEIGVRKAFGASSKTLVGQFIVENIILTFIGSVLGIVFSVIILALINNSQLIPDAYLSVNLNVLFLSLVTCLVFGLLSGVYPAWRMSKLHVVTALKAQ